MISVIIPTYNRADVLDRVLPSYGEPNSVAEILVVDDGGNDNTEMIVTGYQSRDPRIKYLRHATNLGMTFARNTGITHSKGDLVLFSEDDLELAPGSLNILLAHMLESGADIIAGRRIWMRIGESKEEALSRANRSHWPVVNHRLLEHYSHAITSADVPAALVNATMLVRREVLDQVQFANCYPGNAWREESDFQLTAQEKGFRVYFCPHAVFYHYDRKMPGRGNSRLKSDVVYLYWTYRNNLTFLRRHKEYLLRTLPKSLILGSPSLTNLIYIAYRGTLLTQTELRRAWRSHRYS